MGPMKTYKESAPHIQLTNVIKNHHGRLDRTFQSTANIADMCSDGQGTVQRTLASYGSMRPAPAFTKQTRNEYFAHETAIDMTPVPAPFNDVAEGTREKDCPNAGSFQFYDGGKVDLRHVELLKNHSLMLPSERFREAQVIKAGKEAYAEAQRLNRMQSKQRAVVAAWHERGLVGVDGPCYPGTKYYAEERERFKAVEKYQDDHRNRRREFLGDQNRAAPDFFPEVTGWNKSYAPPKRSWDIPLQRLGMDEGNAPNTHKRIFPKNLEPQWDPIRAQVLKHHQDRAKRYDLISHCDNHVEMKIREVQV